jgi:outer membrane protein TolC
MRRALLVTITALGAHALPGRATAQDVKAGRDSIGYGELMAATSAADPRQRQLRLQDSAAALRLRSIAAERLPTLSLGGQAQHQSAVTKIPLSLPGMSVPMPPHDTYDAHLAVEQPVLDPTLAARRDVERARLTESRAQVRATLFGLRQEVTDAFFTAAALQARAAETNAAIVDLTARLREMVLRFHEGTALRGDTAFIAATLDERRQDRLALGADRAAALARLSLLAGWSIPDSAVLVIPDMAARARDVAREPEDLRARPEYEQFAATRVRLAQQSRLATAQERPRVSAYGRAGYGRPGLDMLSSNFQSYWVAGVQLQWTPFRWGTTARDRELLALESEIVGTNEAAFSRTVARSIQPTLATIARLDSTLALDEHIVILREQVEHEARVQLAERVITAAAYVDKNTDLLAARLRRVQHRVALEQARATLLNTLGVEVH